MAMYSAVYSVMAAYVKIAGVAYRTRGLLVCKPFILRCSWMTHRTRGF